MILTVKRAESPEEIEGARSLRLQVFVEEQGVPRDIEIDELDATALHAVSLRDGIVVGTGRLILDSATQARIGRMAVSQPLRHQGTGSAILSFLEDEARTQGIQRVSLHAQSYVKEFYARLAI